MTSQNQKHPLYQTLVKNFKMPVTTIALWIGFSRAAVSYHLHGIYNFPKIETALIDLKKKLEKNFPNVTASASHKRYIDLSI